jgi:hypothetical protein
MKTYLAIVVLSVFLFFPASNASGKDTKDEAKVMRCRTHISQGS